jgi:hypothetical protein
VALGVVAMIARLAASGATASAGAAAADLPEKMRLPQPASRQAAEVCS